MLVSELTCYMKLVFGPAIKVSLFYAGQKTRKIRYRSLETTTSLYSSRCVPTVDHNGTMPPDLPTEKDANNPQKSNAGLRQRHGISG